MSFVNPTGFGYSDELFEDQHIAYIEAFIVVDLNGVRAPKPASIMLLVHAPDPPKISKTNPRPSLGHAMIWISKALSTSFRCHIAEAEQAGCCHIV